MIIQSLAFKRTLQIYVNFLRDLAYVYTVNGKIMFDRYDCINKATSKVKKMMTF